MELTSGISCIYRITNRVTGEFYIGQTKAIEKRHRYPSNYKNSTKLYEDIQNYGWFNFDRELVELVPEDKLDEREFYYIQKEKPFYNIRYGEDNVNQIAESTKVKLSDIMAKSPSIKRKSVRNIDTGEEFESLTAAAEKHGVTKISISRACKGIYKTSGGYRWEYQ